MRNAGYLILLSAVLHVAGVALAGFSAGTLVLILPALTYVVLYVGLARGWMPVAWLAFVAMLVGAAGAVAELAGVPIISSWVLWGILAADLAAAGLIFAAIWKGKTAEAA